MNVGDLSCSFEAPEAFHLREFFKCLTVTGSLDREAFPDADGLKQCTWSGFSKSKVTSCWQGGLTEKKEKVQAQDILFAGDLICCLYN